METSFEEYGKALSSLSAALSLEANDIVRDASIQRFEFCVELAWKTSKKAMGTNTSSPKQVIREMAQDGLIDDPVFWLESIDMRNLSVHTYKEELAEKVFAFSRTFLPKALALLGELKKL